jgi:hypothetical protein
MATVYPVHKFINLIIFSIGMSACAPVDVTRNPEMSHLYKKCFQIKRESILHTRACGDVDAVMHSWTLCHAVQVPGACLPLSREGYENDFQVAQNQFRECLDKRTIGSQSKSEIKGFLPAGSRIRISRVIQYSVGTTATCWITRAVLETGEYSGLEVELPSCIYHEKPMWIDPVVAHWGIPQINAELLAPCDL